MKEKLALVIAALLITSMALSIPTTSVSADVYASATLSPTEVRDETRIKLTITVTNLTDKDIDNVVIKVMDTGDDFTEAIGGPTTAEALENAADNMENAVAPLKWAGENLKLAADNKEDAGQDMASAATDLDAAADLIAVFSPGWENNVAINLIDAATYLKQAGDNMESGIENLVLIENLLAEAALKMSAAAGTGTLNMQAYNLLAATNLGNAATDLDNAATALYGGSLLRAGENLVSAGTYLYNAGDNLSENSTSAGAKMESAGTSLQSAGNNLIEAANYLENAGYALGMVENSLLIASSSITSADTEDLTTAGSSLEDAALAFERAENALIATPENFLAAGENLSIAADNLDNAATELGVDLGGDYLGDAMVHENAAAENMKIETVNLKVAGEQLVAAGDDLSAAASKLLATANAIAPATWDLPSDATNQIRFATIGENENWLRPDESLTFTFLWKTPDISIENTYTLRIALYEVGDVPLSDPLVGYADVTLTVDGQAPILTIYVTQVGVWEDTPNLVGNALDNARATIHIFSSEPLQSIGTVYVENSGGDDENLLPPIENTALTKISDTEWKYEYITVGEWDDNTVVVRVASAKDIAGVENTEGMENIVTVDTRPPIFENSGVMHLVAGLRDNVVQAETGTIYEYVDNKAAHVLSVIVTDNIPDATGKNVVSVTVEWDTSSASAVRDALIDNLWSVDPLTLSAGYNSIVKVTATDRMGQTVTDNIENIFIDTAAPTIEFNTITGKAGAIAFTDGVKINDNTPEIKITVTDPGYPTSGLGVARPAVNTDNLRVVLDNDDNILNSTPYLFAENLENKAPWDPSTGVFENVIENAGLGLMSGTYWINVVASDNMEHAGKWTVTASRKFVIDVTPLDTANIGIQGWTAAIGTIDSPSILTTATRTIVVTIPAGEIGGTIKVYVNGVVEVTTTMDTATKGIDIPLTAGVTNTIELTFTDLSGNESDKLLYGYLMPDATAPTVSITVPESGITTDAASVNLEATVTKDTWETYTELIVRIDATSLIAPIEAANALSTDGKLARAIGLVEGTNTISVSVQDAAGNWSTLDSVTVTRTVTPWATYAIIIVIVALVMSAIAIFRKR